MYNKALSLYFIHPFEQFPTFFSEYKQDFLFMLTLYGINLCYYSYIFSSHFSKVILTTEEVITATLKLSQPLQKWFLALKKWPQPR